MNQTSKSTTKPRISPALLQFNNAAVKPAFARSVRHWIRTSGMVSMPNSVPVLASIIISEARGRIKHYDEAPLEALSHSAVIGTCIYRDASRDYAQLQHLAQRAFGRVFA
jgi:hypothetical protein